MWVSRPRPTGTRKVKNGKENICWIGILLLAFLSSCSPQELHEARDVVTQADSLRAEGKMYGADIEDSASLAQAYETLRSWRVCYPTDFVHACYHYGRLLREKENPVEAMQVFIDATHSYTHDYHILGRVYSNMGDICHLANEFDLSYDMFNRSADCFLRESDTVTYNYAVYRMAFSKAEIADSINCLSLLHKIESIPELKELILMTKAELYKKCNQYDSAIYYVNQSKCNGIHSSTCALVKAYAFLHIGINDSALLYANIVLSDTLTSYQNKFNAMYVVSHLDSTLCSDEVRALDSQREDIRYYEYEPEKEKLSQAIQLLKQNLNHRHDWRGYVVISVLLISIIVSIALSIVLKHRKNQMHEQVVSLANQQATNMLKSIKQHILSADIYSTLHWKDYVSMKTNVDLYMGSIVTKLETYHLNEVEIRFCVLTLLDYRLRVISKILNYSYPSAIKTLKKRISNKLGTTPPDLKDFLLHILPQT